MPDKKIALVTGASRGIGKAIAKKLSLDGFFVIGTATSDANADKLSKYFEEEKLDGIGKKLELSDQESIIKFTKDIISEYGCIDVIVNNAGITRDNLLMRMKDDEWSDVINVNLTSVFTLTKNLIKPMLKKRWGRIVNISSVVGAAGNPGQANYCSTKAGIVGFSKSLAIEVANRNITVNCVAPGFIATDMTSALDDTQKDSILKNVPMNKLGSSEDIAHSVSFLVSGGADYITGQTIHVNGGMYLA